MNLTVRQVSHWRLAIAASIVGLTLSHSARATVVTLDDPITEHVRDNTLIEDPAGSLSNGGTQFFFVGRVAAAGNNRIRRGLLDFNVADIIPAGSTINSVTLTLHMSKTPTGNTNVTLHKLLADWGEGSTLSTNSNGGTGGPAATGDATWLHRIKPQTGTAGRWTNPGAEGDYVGAASATTAVGSTATNGGFYSWTGSRTPAVNLQMVQDVQIWLDNPASDFGWLLKGNEATSTTAKRFDSSENSVANRPKLIIDFTTPPPPVTGDVNNDRKVTRADIGVVTTNWSRVAGADLAHGDAVNDDRVNLLDLMLVRSNFGAVGSPPASVAAVPEPSALAPGLCGLGASLAVVRCRSRGWRAMFPF